MLKRIFTHTLIALMLMPVSLFAQSDVPGTIKYPTALDNADSLIRAANNATSTLSGSISDSATSLTLASGTVFPTSGAVSIENEIIYYTGKSTNTLTGLVRGRDGTTAASHLSGVTVAVRITARHHNVLADSMIAVQTKLGYGSSAPTIGKLLRGSGTGTSAWGDLTASEVVAGYNEVAYDTYGSLSSALSAIGSTATSLVVSSAITVASSATIPTNVNLRITGQGSFSISSGQTLTINGMLEAPLKQIFSGSGTVAFGGYYYGNPSIHEVYPQWWGAKGDDNNDDTAAIQKMLDCFGIGTGKAGRIIFPAGIYKISNTLTYQSDPGTGLYLGGSLGGTRGPSGSRIKWAGPSGGILFLSLAANGLTMENLEWDGQNSAQTGLWFESTAEYSATTTVNVATIARSSNVITVTTSAAHGLAVGEIVKLAGVADKSFNVLAKVATAANSTTFTLLNKGSNVSTSGGTASRLKTAGSSGIVLRRLTVNDVLGTNSAAIAFGHPGSSSSQVSEVTLYDCFLSGKADGTSISGIRTWQGGNTKNYALYNCGIFGFNYNVDFQSASGSMYISQLNSAYAQVADLRMGSAVLTVNGMESETAGLNNNGAMLLVGDVGANPGSVVLQGVSWESAPPSNDVFFDYEGNVTLIGNSFHNKRSGATGPVKIAIGDPLFNNGSPCTVFSQGNWYQNATAGSYIFVVDGGLNNRVYASGYYENTPVSVVSIGDYGGVGGAITRLKNVVPVATVVSANNQYVSSSGFLRMGINDLIKYRNQANNGDVAAMGITAYDQIALGDTAGIHAKNKLQIVDSANGSNNLTLEQSGANQVLRGYTGTFYLDFNSGLQIRAQSTAITYAQVDTNGLSTTGLNVGSGTTLTKILKGTVTIDPASINANTVAEQSFTLTGAATGDSLRLNPPTAGLTAGLTVMQVYVSATNTIKVTFWNSTGSSIDEASASWVFSIIR